MEFREFLDRECDLLNEISICNEQIEKAADKGDFKKVAELSDRMQKGVNDLKKFVDENEDFYKERQIENATA